MCKSLPRHICCTILLLVLLPVFKAVAQRPVYAKMSSLVREACIKARNTDNHSGRRLPRTYQNGRITAFVKSALTADELSGYGCKVLATYGNVSIVSLTLDNISALSLDGKVARIEAGRRAKTTMDTTAIIVKASVLREGIGLPQRYTGKGVVVGVQDIGFDLTHPTFYSQDMSRYRIKAMWDQLSTDTVGSRLPVGRDYRDSLSLLTVGHPLDGLAQTHGTHTAGIAAGSGAEGEGVVSPYIGIAPDADICLVCNATTDDADLIPDEDEYKYTYAVDALGFKYIFDYADSVGKPCVINFSEGSYEDLRGDDMLYYEMLDSLMGPGHIIVASAGNEGANVNYLRKPADVADASLRMTSYWHRSTMSFTTRSDGSLTLRMSLDGETTKDFALADIIASPDSMLTDSVTLGGVEYKLVAVAYPDCYDDGRTATDWLFSSESYIYPKLFDLQVSGGGDVEMFPGSALFENSDNASNVQMDNSHSILSPGSAPRVICVGMTGYRTSMVNYSGILINYGGSRDGAVNVNSSVGPTLDGRMKPDVVAPGQNVISAYSSFYIENNPTANDIYSDKRHFTYNGRTYAWNSNMGTSMASPVVAGVIALWLQANPKLTPEDCIDIFSKTCTHHDAGMTYPNTTYGYGEIDAEAGLKLVLERMTGIRAVMAGKDSDGKIFTLDGRYVGRDTDCLPRGIYIKDNRKILVR